MARKVHLIAEKKHIFDKEKTVCGVPLRKWGKLEFEVTKEMFLGNWTEWLRCKKCSHFVKQNDNPNS